MNIYIDAPIKEIQKNTLKAALKNEYNLFFRDEIGDERSRLDALMSADVVFGNPEPGSLALAAHAGWVQLYSAGFEYYQDIRLPAIVTNMGGYYSEPCAETIIAGILALYRKIDELCALKEKKLWVGHSIRQQLQLLSSKKVIILGAGHIARNIAKILGGFDAEILFFRRSGSPSDINGIEELHEKISWADIIIGCLPGTSETRGLITAEMIGRMKQTAIFCNVGRGNLLENEEDLIQALMDRTLGGAVLDVTSAEPIPPTSRLWDCPNTILSQHSGGGQVSEYEGIVELFLENLDNYENGRPLKNRVNIQKGY